jgi:hypothetical protein
MTLKPKRNMDVVSKDLGSAGKRKWLIIDPPLTCLLPFVHHASEGVR